MLNLPPSIQITWEDKYSKGQKNKTYYLEHISFPDEYFKYSVAYKNNNMPLPPTINDGKECYYLVTIAQTQEEAEKDLMERLEKGHNCWI